MSKLTSVFRTLVSMTLILFDEVTSQVN